MGWRRCPGQQRAPEIHGAEIYCCQCFASGGGTDGWTTGHTVHPHMGMLCQ